MGGTSRSAPSSPTDRQAQPRRRNRRARIARCSPSMTSSSSSETPSSFLDPAQPQVQRLALEVERARRLRLPATRRQVRLERLQQRAGARRPVREQRAELLVDERVEFGRIAQVVQEVGDAGPARVVPARDREPRRRARRAPHPPQRLPGRDPRTDRRADRQRRVRGPQPVPIERAVEQVRDVLGQRRVIAARAEREQDQQIDVARARAARRSRSRTARSADRPTAASR